MSDLAATVRRILADIRFEQTLFSLPFALLSALLAARGMPDGRTLLLVVAALVTARSAAMAVNRAADARIDARNPRTKDRAVASGAVRRSAMWIFSAVATALFVTAAAALNPLCLKLAPVALLFLVGYSWTKRFTPLCHVILGMTLGIAPLGAWVAVRGTLGDPEPWALAAAVTFWVGGFDVIYACPDAEVDRREGLRSIPAALGPERAFAVSRAMHVAVPILLGWAGWASEPLRFWWWAGLGIASAVLVLEHRMVAPGRYERMAAAFFRMNAVFSVVLLSAGAADVFPAR